jgi:hypothetical protein
LISKATELYQTSRIALIEAWEHQDVSRRVVRLNADLSATRNSCRAHFIQNLNISTGRDALREVPRECAEIADRFIKILVNILVTWEDDMSPDCRDLLAYIFPTESHELIPLIGEKWLLRLGSFRRMYRRQRVERKSV